MSVKVPVDVEKLSVAERLQLMEELWESFVDSPDVLSPTDEQLEEAKRRLDAYRKDPDAAISLERFVAEVNTP